MTHISLTQATAEIYVPDGTPEPEAVSRTTHLAIGAHHDDLEIMAAHGILECFARQDRWFLGVVTSDGAGSPRDADYKDFTDEQMKKVRRLEQKKAAFVGEYAAQVLLDHKSSAIKDPKNESVVADFVALLRAARPKVVYTHNLADKHDTHVGVVLKVIRACRALPAEERPEKLIGCEVWRDLDWLCDKDKVVMPVNGHENLQSALMGVFDSQIVGGKRYDLATAGRRKAHATYFESHETDQNSGLVWGMDLSPLLVDPKLSPFDLFASLIGNLTSEVRERMSKIGG
jgi:LmbE family N-acetylglucosaminyl deacetylase